MSQSTSNNQLLDDEFSDIVKISPPTSSSSLMSYNHVEDKDPIKSESSSSSSNPSTGSSSDDSQSSKSSLESKPSEQKDIKLKIPSTPNKPSEETKTSSNGSYKTPNPITPSKKEVKPTAEVLKDVHGVMEDTVKRVRQQSDKLQTAAQPYADKTRNFAESKPVLFTLIVLWIGFSSIPILIFLGFILAASVFIFSMALFISALIVIGAALMGGAAIIGTILFGAAILAPVLFVTTLLAFGSLITLLGLFLIHRLYLHISISSSEEGLTATSIGLGIKSWFEETYQRFLLLLPNFNKTPSPVMTGEPKKWSPVEQVTSGGILKRVNGEIGNYHSIPPNNEYIKLDNQILNHDQGIKINSSNSSSYVISKPPIDHYIPQHHRTTSSEKIGQGDIKDIPRLDILNTKSHK